MAITPGVYIITNVQQGNPVYLESPDDEVPLRGHYKPGDARERWYWNVIDLKNGSYSIQNVEYKRYANCGSRAGLKAHILGASWEQEWDIQAIGSEGEYTIGAIDSPNIWMLPTKGKDTPVELFNIPTDRRCWWTFTNLETRAPVIINKDPEDKYALNEDEYILFELKILPIPPFSPLKLDFIIIQQSSEDSISNTFATIDGLCGPLVSLGRLQPDALSASIVEFRCPIPNKIFFHRVSSSLTFGTLRNSGHADLSWKSCGGQAFPQMAIRGLRADATKVAILNLNVSLIEQSGQAIITLINALVKQDIALILTPIQQTWADTFYKSQVFQELENLSSERRLFERKDQFSDYVVDYNEMVALPRLAEDRELRDSIHPNIPRIVEALKDENGYTRSDAVAALSQLAAHVDLRDVILQAMHKVTEMLKGNSWEAEAVASALIKLAECAELHDQIFDAVHETVNRLKAPREWPSLVPRLERWENQEDPEDSGGTEWGSPGSAEKMRSTLGTRLGQLAHSLREGPSHHSSLQWAANRGYEAFVRILLAQEGVDVDAKDQSRSTPLFLAAANGHDGVVRLLLAHKDVNVNYKEYDDDTPLGIAVKNRHTAVVQLLLAHKGVDVNSKGSFGTPLYIAAKNGHDAVVRLLLAHNGVDVNYKEYDDDTPLGIAVKNRHTAVVQLLLAHKGVDVNSKGSFGTPLYIAAKNGHDAVVRLLLAHNGVDVNYKEYDDDTPLGIAVKNRHTAVVQLLLAHKGVDVNSKGSFGTPLYIAAKNGHDAVVRLLLAHNGVDVNYKEYDDDTPLGIAVKNRHTAVVQLLLAHKGVDVNSKGSFGTPLYIAAKNGHDAVVRLLLAHNGVDVNYKEYDDDTPLGIAVKNRHTAVVQLLLAHEGVDVNSRGHNNDTPLHIATRNCRDTMVRLILDHEGVDVNSTDNNGATPLHIAAERCSTAIAQLLLSKEGVDVNFKQRDGNTPLHIAVSNRAFWNHAVEDLLAQEGVDVNAMNNDGQTPLKLAKKAKNKTAVRLLQEKIQQMEDTTKERTAKDSRRARWFRSPTASTSGNTSK